jgi:hypothetical protein
MSKNTKQDHLRKMFKANLDNSLNFYMKIANDPKRFMLKIFYLNYTQPLAVSSLRKVKNHKHHPLKSSIENHQIWVSLLLKWASYGILFSKYLYFMIRWPKCSIWTFREHITSDKYIFNIFGIAVKLFFIYNVIWPHRLHFCNLTIWGHITKFYPDIFADKFKCLWWWN